MKGTDGQHRWIIDPLDGTTNFLHGIPLFAVAIALQRGDEIVASVILQSDLRGAVCRRKGRRRLARRQEAAAGCQPQAPRRLRGVDRHQGDRHALRRAATAADGSDFAGGCRNPAHRIGLDRPLPGWPPGALTASGKGGFPLGRGAGLAAAAQAAAPCGFCRHARPASGTARWSPATNVQGQLLKIIKGREIAICPQGTVAEPTPPSHCHAWNAVTTFPVPGTSARLEFARAAGGMV